MYILYCTVLYYTILYGLKNETKHRHGNELSVNIRRRAVHL